MPRLNKSANNVCKSQINVYQQHTQVDLTCVVCLIKSKENMYNLCDKLDLTAEEYWNLTIQEGLQKVTASQVIMPTEHPYVICSNCFSNLKISLKFIYQFEKNQKEIWKSPCKNNVPGDKNHNGSSVELIYGDHKYSLNEVLVVEPNQPKEYKFSGFLNNLGKEISATFAEITKPEDSAMTDDTGQEEVSISLVGNNKELPVKELEMDENSNVIKCIVVEDDNGGDDEILKFVIEDKDEIDENEFIQMDVRDVDLNETLGQDVHKKMDAVSTKNNRNHHKLGKENVKQTDNDIFKKEMKYPCDICKKVFDLPCRLKAHKSRTHDKKIKVYHCSICGHKNYTLSAHTHHKIKHIGKKWSCNICSKTYYTKAVLKVHMQTHINKREHLCTVCGEGFNYANALVYHMRRHTGEKNYTCKYCNQAFRMKNSLSRHLRCHTGERPYQCKYCDKAFRSKGELKCHEYGHTGCRPYNCTYCQKGFSKTHNLKLHLLSHGGPHKCDLCRRNFIEPAVLSMHYKISHKDVVGESVESENGL